MMRLVISGSGSDSLPGGAFAFLWLAFLLFPIAHLSTGGGIPIYWSEAAIGCSFLALILSDPKGAGARFLGIIRAEFQFFLFSGLFLSGIVLAYCLNPHSLSGWGEIKSFYIVPILFLTAVLVQAETKERIELLASGWLLGLAAASLAGAMTYLSGWLSYDGRLTSFYLSPNYLAMLVAPGVLLSIYFFAACPRYWYQLAMLILGGLMLFVLWATHSYAAWGAVLIACVAGIFLWRSGKPVLYAAPLVVTIIILSGVFFLERGTEKWQSLVSGSERSSLASRLMIWRSGVKIAEDSFPVGIGTGRFQELYLANQEYYPTYLEWAVPTPHNLYLHFLLEGGVLALVGWFGCIIIVMKRSLRSLRQAPGNRLLILGLSLVVFYLVYGLVDTPYMKNDLALAVWGSLGLSLSALRIKA
jgi:O-antigen ligase